MHLLDRLKKFLKIHKLFVNAQFILGPKFPVLCGTADYPYSLEIARLTHLLEYYVEPTTCVRILHAKKGK